MYVCMYVLFLCVCMYLYVYVCVCMYVCVYCCMHLFHVLFMYCVMYVYVFVYTYFYRERDPLSLHTQPTTAPNLFQRGVECGKSEGGSSRRGAWGCPSALRRSAVSAWPVGLLTVRYGLLYAWWRPHAAKGFIHNGNLNCRSSCLREGRLLRIES